MVVPLVKRMSAIYRGGFCMQFTENVRANLTQIAQHGLDIFFTIRINRNVSDRRFRIGRYLSFIFIVFWTLAKKNFFFWHIEILENSQKPGPKTKTWVNWRMRNALLADLASAHCTSVIQSDSPNPKQLRCAVSTRRLGSSWPVGAGCRIGSVLVKTSLKC